MIKIVRYPNIHLMSSFFLKRKLQRWSPAMVGLLSIADLVIGIALFAGDNWFWTIFAVHFCWLIIEGDIRYKELLAESNRRKGIHPVATASKVENVTHCTNCGKAADSSHQFCSSCGSKVNPS